MPLLSVERIHPPFSHQGWFLPTLLSLLASVGYWNWTIYNINPNLNLPKFDKFSWGPQFTSSPKFCENSLVTFWVLPITSKQTNGGKTVPPPEAAEVTRRETTNKSVLCVNISFDILQSNIGLTARRDAAKQLTSICNKIYGKKGQSGKTGWPLPKKGDLSNYNS